jgi:hypothetical protein
MSLMWRSYSTGVRSVSGPLRARRRRGIDTNLSFPTLPLGVRKRVDYETRVFRGRLAGGVQFVAGRRRVESEAGQLLAQSDFSTLPRISETGRIDGVVTSSRM